jgi:hypothetical protein
MVSGTPSATPDALPKLDRMSLRTMPLSVSMFGPLDPSPGYGPAVSSGIVSQEADASTDAAELCDAAGEPVGEVVADGDADALAEVLPPPGTQAASANMPAPMPALPISFSSCRRPTTVSRSNVRPWSKMSSSGFASGRPS